ncbi:MAG: exodeoxyribonuclease VII small subunit [Anaerolineae bacterium]|nr:exodeoxyribonuclease VII small subunit [Anaerolineae bacterium]
MTSPTASLDGLDFEEAYRSLQEVVEQLEKGNLPLQDSLALFERGMLLVRRCAAVLDQAEMKIVSLSQELDADLGQVLRNRESNNAPRGGLWGDEEAS